jgi:hypothetical protein
MPRVLLFSHNTYPFCYVAELLQISLKSQSPSWYDPRSIYEAHTSRWASCFLLTPTSFASFPESGYHHYMGCAAVASKMRYLHGNVRRPRLHWKSYQQQGCGRTSTDKLNNSEILSLDPIFKCYRGMGCASYLKNKFSVSMRNETPELEHILLDIAGKQYKRSSWTTAVCA